MEKKRIFLTKDNYCGDREMAEVLETAGSIFTFSEIYGLFHGCTAAPHPVMPEQYLPEIFGRTDKLLETIENSDLVIDNLMSLWNIIDDWDAETSSFTFPQIVYPDNHDGLQQRLKNIYSIIEYFIKGLDMGHVAETDFSKGGFEALKLLSETGASLWKLISSDRSSISIIMNLEEVTADCIAKMNLALKDARIKENEYMQMLMEPENPIPKDSPCHCGSGRNYNRCCGLFH